MNWRNSGQLPRELVLVRKPLEDRVVRLEQDLEQAELRGEFTMLRVLESLRAEHQRALDGASRAVDQRDQEKPCYR